MAVEADHLVKRFGHTLAVNDVSFAVPEGSVLGLLGPNGAGKTTTVRMLTTLSVPTAGTGRVAGHDVIKEPDLVRRSMGLTGQAATVDELLTGRENIRLIGRLYGLPLPYLRRAADRLLEQFSLSDAGDRFRHSNAPAAAAPDAALPLHHPVVASVCWSIIFTLVFAPLATAAFRRRSRD